MPFIQIKVFKGALSDEKKAEMIARVSEVVAEIEARPGPMEKLLPNVWCQIEEMPFGSFASGGKAVTKEQFEAAMAAIRS